MQFLSNLQMSVRPSHSGWYPCWFVMRRTIITICFMASKFGYFTQRFDWRIASVFVLAFASVVHFHIEPFRREFSQRRSVTAVA